MVFRAKCVVLGEGLVYWSASDGLRAKFVVFCEGLVYLRHSMVSWARL